MKNRALDARTIALIAIMAAVTCIFTLIVRVPIRLTGGYVHLGDVAATFVSLAFGPWLGLAIAGGGTALADLLGGFAFWSPFSFVIHGLQGFVAGYVAYLGRQRTRSLILGALLGELIVVAGYFLVALFYYGLNAAVAELLGNVIQGAVGMLGVPLLLMVSRAYPPLLSLFGGGRAGSDNRR